MKRKIRKFRGGGMDASKSDFKSPSVNKSVTNNNKDNKGSKIGPVVKDVPFKKPLGTVASTVVGSLGVPFLGTAINFAAKQNYKAKQKFARKEGLYRDSYRTTGRVLQPNAPTSRNYLKEAGFRKNTPTIPTGGNNGNNNIAQTTKPVDPNLVKPKENFFNFVAYKVGGLSGGVSYGPPPKRGPNPNVPPIKMKHGSKKEIKAGYHKMPDGSIMKNSDHKGSK